ncbi:MAG: hypothetical protein FJ403_15635 [Verrucomicrobia bacterium]|nr:hypothetical protein [Verrucomicrobiota bacterium]
MKALALIPAFGLGLLPVVVVQSQDSDRPHYKTGPFATKKLGFDIQRALKPQYQDKVHVEPILMELDDMPFVKLEELPEEPKPLPVIMISQGFVDLINNVAHAKAIDKIEKGYFQKYILSLAQETGEKELKPLPKDTNPAYWTEDMINEQYSNFNSIVGTMVGVKLANHYLGHYKKYATQMNAESGKQTPMNNLLTPKEWDEVLRLGVRNALDAGCTIEGVLPFFECFDKMPKRPAWTSFCVPDTAKYREMRRALEKIQKDFFAGKE